MGQRYHMMPDGPLHRTNGATNHAHTERFFCPDRMIFLKKTAGVQYTKGGGWQYEFQTSRDYSIQINSSELLEWEQLQEYSNLLKTICIVKFPSPSITITCYVNLLAKCTKMFHVHDQTTHRSKIFYIVFFGGKHHVH
jgi:hypothetical protein